MNDKIIKIEKVENYTCDQIKYGSADGYVVVTTEQNIYLLIDNGTSCCESWGYFMSEDNFNEFIGSTLYEITVTDKALETIVFEEYLGPEDMDAGGMMFVNLNTSAGVLQFVAYNAHNGYYGHTAYVLSKELNHEEYL